MINSKYNTEAKVGIFVIAAVVGIIFLSIVTSDSGFSFRGYNHIYLQTSSANGITHKTPVQLAGISVGFVDEISFSENNQALLKIKMNRGIELKGKLKASIRTRGVLGDTYIELISEGVGDVVSSGATVTDVEGSADINDMVQSFNEIAKDVKAITATLKNYTVAQDALIPRILNNMDVLTKNIATITSQNAQSINVVMSNLRAVTGDLRYLVSNNSGNVNASLDSIENITRKIDQGQGTIGKLINDDSTVKKLNEVADNLNNTLGGINRMKTKVGWHVEYLGETQDFKNYATLVLAPKPDKFFQFDVVSDSDPSATTIVKTTNVTAGGSTSTVVTEENTVNRNKVLFSAQMGKKFGDITLRGGLIESTGGIGVDYTKGPVDFKFSAFDFRNDNNQRPHLKAAANVNVTKNIFLTGGVDDIISKQHSADWFLGAGVQFDDEDIKSILGMATLSK